MADRFSKVFSLPRKLYLEGSPVIIEAGAIQKDALADKLLAQIKFRNVSAKTIIACRVNLKAYTVSGEEREGVEGFTYLDLNILSGDCFGDKTPIYLPDYDTREFTACVTQIVFADKSIWQTDETEWKPVSKPKKIETVLRDDSRIHDGELVKQYKIEVGNNSDYYPEIKDGLFYCTCGSMNMDSVEQCYFCRREYSDLARILEDGYLASRKDARLAREAEERRVKMQQEAEERAARIQRKQEDDAKRKKIIKIAVPVVVVLAFFAIAGYYIFSIVIPRQKHDEAMQLLALGNYESAYAILTELGDTDTVIASKNERALSLFESGNYDEAFLLLESTGNTDVYWEEVREVMSNSVADAYAILANMDQSNPYVVELMNICEPYIPYCRDYHWPNRFACRLYFSSDFAIDRDGTVFWRYNDENDTDSSDESRFVDWLEVVDMQVVMTREDGLYVFASFEDGKIKTWSSTYDSFSEYGARCYYAHSVD